MQERTPAGECYLSLERDGLLELRGGELRTTRRWQGAMARAAYRLMQDDGDTDFDLRKAIACALLELYGASMTDDVIADRIEAILPIEEREIAP